jgi:hypothetical protein
MQLDITLTVRIRSELTEQIIPSVKRKNSGPLLKLIDTRRALLLLTCPEMQRDIILTFRKQSEHTEQIIPSGKKKFKSFC